MFNPNVYFNRTLGQQMQNELRERAAQIHCEKMRLAICRAKEAHFSTNLYGSSFWTLFRGREFKSKHRLLHLYRTGL